MSGKNADGRLKHALEHQKSVERKGHRGEPRRGDGHGEGRAARRADDHLKHQEEAALDLELAVGDPVVALVKATEVMLGKE